MGQFVLAILHHLAERRLRVLGGGDIRCHGFDVFGQSVEVICEVAVAFFGTGEFPANFLAPGEDGLAQPALLIPNGRNLCGHLSNALLHLRKLL